MFLRGKFYFLNRWYFNSNKGILLSLYFLKLRKKRQKRNTKKGIKRLKFMILQFTCPPTTTACSDPQAMAITSTLIYDIISKLILLMVAKVIQIKTIISFINFYYLNNCSTSLGLDWLFQSPWPRTPKDPSPHVITIPLSLK